MAVWYVDPIAGVDANAGTSFAARCRTLSGVTAKAVVAGDTIRVIKSDDPVAVTGQSTTVWTDGSKTVTLASPVNATIAQSSTAWTAGTANVVCSTSTTRKLGATAAQIAINATFTTGLAAYFPTGTLDLSGYQQVSFWIYMSAGTMSADNDISLALCSDTAGAVVVNTIPIKWIKSTSAWQVMTVDFGAPLGNAIQSVALYVNQDRGAQTFLINNIIACTAPSADNSISLCSLISPAISDSHAWWTIESISGTTISLAQEHPFNLSQTTTASQGFAGPNAVTTTYTGLYKREPIVFASAISESSSGGVIWGSIAKSGNSTSPIVISGGWNTTDMSTQIGETFISTYNGLGYGITFANSQYINVLNINPIRFNTGFYAGSSSNAYYNITAHTIASCSFATSFSGQGPAGTTAIIHNIVQNQFGFYAGNGGPTALRLTSLNISGNSYSGLQLTRNPSTIFNTLDHLTINAVNVRRNGPAVAGTPGSAASARGVILGGVTNSVCTFSNIDRNYGGNLTIGYGGASACSNVQVYFQNTSANSLVVSSTNYTNLQFTDGSNSTVKLVDIASGANIPVSGGKYAIAFNGGGFNNSVIGGSISGLSAAVYPSGSSKFVLQGTSLASGITHLSDTPNTGKDYSILHWQNFNGSATDHRIYFNKDISNDFNGNIVTDATIRHTASGFSWKITGGTTAHPVLTFNTELPIGQFAIKDVSTTYNVAIWVYPTTALSTIKLRVYYSGPHSAAIAGLNYTETTAATNTANTWTQITLPVVVPAGALPGVYSASVIAGNLANATPRVVYVDEFSVSQ